MTLRAGRSRSRTSRARRLTTRVAALAATAAAVLLVLAGPVSATGTAASEGATAAGIHIESADASAYPDIAIEVTAPLSLAAIDLEGSFSLTEHGEPREVLATRSAGAAQEIVLVVDASGSMRGPSMDAAKAAASDFVEHAPAGAAIAVVAFGDSVAVTADFTADAGVLLAAIASLEAGGNTALFDAVGRATDLLAAGPAATETIVVLSDGDDTASVQSVEDASAHVGASAASFFGVQLVTSEADPADLGALTAAVSGTLLTADDAAALSAAYVAIAVNTSNRYTLSYRSAASGPTQVEISVAAGGTKHRVEIPVNLPQPATTAATTSPEPTSGAPAADADALAGSGPLTSPLALTGALLALCAAAFILLFVVLPAPRRRLSSHRRNPLSGEQSSRLAGTTDRVSGFLDQKLARTGWSPVRASALERAGVSMRQQDVVLLAVSAILVAAATGVLLAGPLLAIGFAAAVPAAMKVLLNLLASRRKATFADQLDDTLQLIASSLRAGHSLLRAVDAVAREADAPTSEEFARLINETRLGRDLGPALEDTAIRMDCEDFQWVAQAVAIHREVGGNLAEVLDQVGETIRERNQIRRQVKALSAEGKLSAIVLMSLPVGVTAFLFVSNRGYILTFTESLLGYGMIAAAVTLMSVGALWLRKVVRFQF